MSPLVFGKPLEQGETLLSARVASTDAGVRLIDDQQAWAGAGKFVAAPLGLDIVETDDRRGISGKDALRQRQPALERPCARRGDCDRIDVEFGGELVDPLFDKVRGAQNGETIHLATIKHFTQD